MNILLLGDVVGPAGRKALTGYLPNLIKKKKLDFVVINGENAADRGVGITKKNFDEFMKAGADVVTTGNHIWDEKETMEFITLEKRLLRPQNLTKGSPGKGFGIYNSKNNSYALLMLNSSFQLSIIIILFLSIIVSIGPTLDIFISDIFYLGEKQFIIQSYYFITILFRKILLSIFSYFIFTELFDFFYIK